MMRQGTLEVSGGQLETAWWGPSPADAPTLVLLHEGLGSVELWRDVPELLAALIGWGVFAYSRFGYGRSDPTPLPRPMTYMHHEAQVVLPEVLKAAGIGRCVLVGHSDGGSIAAIYAGSVSPKGSWPGRVRPPTTLEGAIPQGAPGHDVIGLVTIAAHFFVEDLNIASIERIKQEYETGGLRQRMARYHQDVDVAFRGWNGAWLDPDFRSFDIIGLLPNIQVPILALQGADDPYGTDEQLHVLKANVQVPVTTQLIPGAKHAPHLEAQEDTLAAISSFIADLPRDISR
jgi:pimeloyl-ACP methyl ester carboxylesterase